MLRDLIKGVLRRALPEEAPSNSVLGQVRPLATVDDAGQYSLAMQCAPCGALMPWQGHRWECAVCGSHLDIHDARAMLRHMSTPPINST